MSQSYRQLYDSRTSHSERHAQRITSTRQHVHHQMPSENYHELVYKSYQYPEQVGFQDLVSMVNILQQIRSDFKQDRVSFDPYKRQELDKRLFLLEQQIQSLMRYQFVVDEEGRSQSGTTGDGVRGKRTINYGNLLMEKENQIKELDKKIWYYENQYRKDDTRVKELEDQITRLHEIMIQKNRMIDSLSGKQIKEWQGYRDHANYLDTLIADLEKLKRNNSRDLSLNQIQGVLESWIYRLPTSSNLKRKLQYAQQKDIKINKYRDYVVSKLSKANQIYKSQIQELSTSLGSYGKVQYDSRLLKTLSLDDVKGDAFLDTLFGGILEMGIINHHRDLAYSKIVEVPVQDARTKALIYKLAKQMKKITSKYPQIAREIDPRLAEFYSQEIIETIEVDQLDRLVEIVKIEPQVVKVDNVYAYSSQKSRKVEFHLRVLIKALLQEMQKMKMKTGVVPEIDEGVIGMIRNQVLDLVDVDDILKVYRTVPKIVEVEKVVEKVVEKIVEVPKFITAELREQKPVEVQKYEVVSDTVHVPVREPIITPLVQEKLVPVSQIINNVVSVPQIHRYPVETITERLRQVQIQKVVPLQRQVQRIIQVPGPEKIVEIPRTEVVQLIKEKIIQTREEKEKIIEVQKVVEKIVEVVKEIPKIVEVEKLVTKAVPVKEYIESERIVNHVQQKFTPVEVYIQKIIPIYKVEERIVQVPQIIEKIVPVVEVRQEIVEVVRTQEKPVYQTEVKIVEKIKEVPVIEIREVEKIVQKIVEVPIIHEKIVPHETEIIRPFIETIQRTIHKEVQLEKPVVLYEDKIVEVDRVINHCIEVPQIINIQRERLVPYEKVVDRVVATPTIVQKIVEKIVEVPKVVEVQKIVEKIIPVPRIVERVVEVQKIVEKIVKQTIFEEKIVEKQVRVEVPCFQDRIIEVERPVNIYQEKQVPVQVIRQVLVRDSETVNIPQIHEIQVPRIVVETREVQVPMVIEKIVTLTNTDNKYVELKQTEIIPVEINLPVDIIKEKIVPVETVRPQIQVENAVWQKIVQVEVEPNPRVIETDRVVEKLRTEKQYEVVQNRIPYYNENIVEVPVEIQKIIQPVYYEVEKIVQVPQFIEKLVQKVINIPKIYEVQRRVDVPVKDPIIIPIQKLVPQLVTLNQSIQNIVERIVQVPRLVEKLQISQKVDQKVIPQQRITTQIEEIRTIEEKQVIVEQLKVVENKVHLVNEVMKTVERLIERPMEPQLICQEIIMEVPTIVEKIVEKIVVMPQVVQVLKYVHQVMENQDLVASVSNSVEDQEYSRLARSVNLQLSKLRGMLGEIRGERTEVQKQIMIIQSFLAQFGKFLAYPRIREIVSKVQVDRIVEKQKLVQLPVRSSEDAQRNLASAVLIDKLINELRRVKKQYNVKNLQLDEQIMRVFGPQLQSPSKYHGNDYDKILDEYVRAINTRFSSLGPWTSDHQEMLKGFIEDRFELAYNSKKKQDENKKLMMKMSNLQEQLKTLKQRNLSFTNAYEPFKDMFGIIIEEGKRQRRIDQRTQNKFNEIFQSLGMLVQGYAMSLSGERIQPLSNERYISMLRQKEEEINNLKDRIRELMMGKGNCNLNHDHKWLNSSPSGDKADYIKTIRRLQERIRELEIEIERLRIIESQHRGCQSIIDSLRSQINSLRIQISSMRSPSQKDDKGTKHRDSQSGSSYGVNYLEYANLDQNSSDTGKIERGVYRSGNYDAAQRANQYSTHNYSSQYRSPQQHTSTNLQTYEASGSMTGELGTSSKKETLYHSGYRAEYSSGGGDGHIYQTVEYSRGSIPTQTHQMRQARYESSEGGSQIYSSTSRQITRRSETKFEQENAGGSSRRFERSGHRYE